MIKYILKAKAAGDNPGEYQEEEVEEMTQEEFQAYEKGDESGYDHKDISSRAVELRGFEWWIEEVSK